MVEELNCGVMEVIIMENTKQDRNMDKACTIGPMDLNTEESGSRMKCMERVSSYGLMAENIKGHFRWE